MAGRWRLVVLLSAAALVFCVALLTTSVPTDDGVARPRRRLAQRTVLASSSAPEASPSRTSGPAQATPAPRSPTPTPPPAAPRPFKGRGAPLALRAPPAPVRAVSPRACDLFTLFQTQAPTTAPVSSPRPVPSNATGNATGNVTEDSGSGPAPPWTQGPVAGAIPTAPYLMPVATAGGRAENFTMNLVRDNYMGARCLDPPHDGRTYCELSLLHTDLCSSAESFVACAARVGWAEVAGTLSAKCVLSPFFAIVAPPEVVPRHTTAADPRPTHVQDRPRGNVSAGPVPNSWRQWRPAPKPSFSEPSGPGAEPLFSDGPFPYVPPEDRPPSPFPPPRVLPEYTGHDCPVHRMTMAIPEELVAPKVARHKLFGFAPHVPHRYPRTSNRDGFVYPFGRHDEALAYELYRRSHFAFTHRRGCWTAQRHYDILATGCVPVFLDLRLCRDPAECLPGFPVELLQEALALPGVSYLSTHAHLRSTFVDDPIPYHNHWVMNIKGPAVIADGFDRRRYDDLAARMLAWTRANLTTRVMASNFLRRLGPEAERAGRVLVVSNWYLPETGSLLHGLVSLGINVTHRQDDDTALYAAFPHAATELEMAAHRNTVVKRDRRSNGFTYAFRVNRHHFAPASTAAVERGLQERRYDVVVFSVMGWQRPDHALFKRAVAAGYGNTTLAVVDGTDQVRMLRKSASIPVHCHAATLFSREMMPHGREPRPAM